MAKRARGGRFCVAGGPNRVSCTNTSHTPGISMHVFPKNERVRKQWTEFVRRHRHDFSPAATSPLCSVHFEPSCYTRLSLSDLQPEGTTNKEKRVLKKGSIPTIDAALVVPAKKPSDRDIRISKNLLHEIEREAAREAKRDASIDSSTEGGDGAGDTFSSSSESEPEGPITLYCEGDTAEVGELHVRLINKYVQTETVNKTKATQTVLGECQKCEERKTKIRQLQKRNSRLVAQKKHLKNTVSKLRRDSSDDSSGEEDMEVGSQEGEEESGSEESIREAEAMEADDDDNGNGEEEDPDWAGLEERGADDDNETCASSNDISVDEDTPMQNEPKFIVFYTRLLAIFSMFCFNCKEGSPEVKMKKNGMMVTVEQSCRNCGHQSFVWRSQPLVLGRYPAGNLLLSFGVLMAGASVTKVLLVLKHMGLCVYSARTYFIHQNKFLFPAILSHWESYRATLINKVKTIKDAAWSGDGRFDSMGHCAKYGAYTMFCCAISKVVHFELVQANQVKSSGDMELKGAQDSFAFLKQAGLSIAVFISDRHRSIAKWIRDQQPNTQHFFDIWHVAKSITKKMLKVGKESGCERITQWQKAIKNHLHWCATSTKAGFGELMVAKWKSVIRHVCNKHKNHPDELFKKCVHGAVSPRFWLKVGTHVYDKLRGILINTRLLNDIRKLSSEDQTSCLEGFHSTLNQFHPKMLCFSWVGTYCRHVLASLHFNENLHRNTQKTRDGKEYFQVTYPKYKLGDEVVREIRVPPTYEYVDNVKKLVFTMPMAVRTEIYMKYKKKAPAPLNTQFPDRQNRADAVEDYKKRKEQVAALYPSAEDQDLLQATCSNASRPAKKRKAPECKKCHQPRKGHPKNGCRTETSDS